MRGRVDAGARTGFTGVMSRRYIVIGAGAIGGGIGGLLSLHGMPAVLVARGDHLDRMRSDGLRLRTPDAEATTPVVAVGGPDEVELTGEDVLVLAVKTQQAEAALAQWADAPVGNHSAGEVLPILTALNGVRAEARALRWFRRVYGVCVWMPAARLVAGEVILRGTPVRGVLHLARVPAPLTSDDDRALLEGIAADWERAELRVVLPADVMPWKYRKLLSNLGNAVQALVGTIDEDVVAAARAEAEGIYAAVGIRMNPAEDERRHRAGLRVAAVPGEPEGLGGSTWQSMARRTGTTEVDFLNGEIVAIAHAAGLDAPINAGLARLTRRASRSGAVPGDLTVGRLRAALSADDPD